MLLHTLLSFLFFSHGFIQIPFGLFDFFYFCFLSNKYYLSKSMLLNPRCQKSSFLYKQTFLSMRSNWHTKVKVFHESTSYFMKCPWKCISWNTLKEKFHSVSFPLANVLLSKVMSDIYYWKKLTFSKLWISQKENLKKCTSFEEQKRRRYIRENVYFGINIFSCLSSTKLCLQISWLKIKISKNWHKVL